MATLLNHLLPLRHAALLGILVRRELHARYRQNLLGSVWLVLAPVAMLGILTFVFRHVMGVRWAGRLPADTDLAFGLQLFAGLAIFQCVADCVSRAPQLVSGQPQLVKKVVFPLELLAWVHVGAGMATLGVAGLLMCLAALWLPTGLPASALALPLLWLPIIPLLLGLSWTLSAAGAFVPDVAQLVSPVVSALMFLSPILYPVDALPPGVRPWMTLNPVAEPITQTRRVLFEGAWPDWHAWALHATICLIVALLGAAFFRRLRGGFADVV